MAQICLQDSHALVTGGGTGIGRGIALALARRGATVTLVGRRSAPLTSVAREVEQLGRAAYVVPADLALPAERARVLHQARAGAGLIDVLVNNAGMLAGGPLLWHDARTLERAVAVNLAAPMDLVRLALPELAVRQGSVVLVGSAMSYVPMPYATLYAATKAGLRAFGEALRYEAAAFGVHVLLVYPPGTATDLVRPLARPGRRSPALADPNAAGERIIAALEAGRTAQVWGMGERLLLGLNRLAPGLARRILFMARTRFLPTPYTELHHG